MKSIALCLVIWAFAASAAFAASPFAFAAVEVSARFIDDGTTLAVPAAQVTWTVTDAG